MAEPEKPEAQGEALVAPAASAAPAAAMVAAVAAAMVAAQRGNTTDIASGASATQSHR